MKKTISIAFCLSLLAIAACNKSNIDKDGGSWTLHANTYKATQAFYVLGGITAYTGETNNPSGSLALWFRNAGESDSISISWPPKDASYILTNVYSPAIGFVFFQLTDTSVYYSY